MTKLSTSFMREGVFCCLTYALLGLLFFLPGRVNGQQSKVTSINSLTSTPWITTSGVFSVTETHSSTGLGASWNGTENVTNSGTSDFATAIVPLGGSATLKVSDSPASYTYNAGNFVGFVIKAVGIAGVLDASILSNITIKTYLNGGQALESSSASSILALSSTIGGATEVGFYTTKPYNQIEITFSGILQTYNVYYAVMRTYAASASAPACNTATQLNLPTFPVVVNPINTGVSGISVGSITNEDNAVSSSTTDFASINLLLSTGTASFSIKDQKSTYTAGSYAGLDISSPSLLSLNALGGITISTYLSGTATGDSFSGTTLISAGSSILSGSGRQTVGGITTKDFDEIKLTLSGANVLGVTNIYGAVVEKFCTGPSLACGDTSPNAIPNNTLTPLTNPTHPVYVDGRNTGFTGAVCAACAINNPENVVDNNPSNFASIVLTAGVSTSASFAVANALQTYPVNSYAGFDIQANTLLSASVLSTATISLYNDGALVQTGTGNALIVGATTALLTGTTRQIVGLVATAAYDEVKITFPSFVGVDLGTINIYSAIFEKTCAATLVCNTSYNLSNPAFPVVIDAARTGVTGAVAAATTIQDPQNVVSASATDFARITNLASVATNASIAVLDPIDTYPVGTFAGFTVKKVSGLVTADLFSRLTVTTYLDGVQQESRSATGLLDLSIILFGSTTDFLNAGFVTTKAFDEVQLTVAPLVGLGVLSGNLDVYGAFIDTRTSTGGGLACALTTNPDFSVTNKNVPATGNVKTNDAVPAGTTYGPAPSPAVQPGGSTPTLTVNADGTFTFTSATPGVYVYNVPVCGAGLSGTSCATQTLTITVLDPTINTNKPVANPDIAVTTGAPSSPTAITVNIKANDGPGNAGGTLGTPTIVTPAAHGTASIDGSGNLVYTPTAGYYGTDVVTYQVCETPGTSLCASTTVTITVKAPGSPNTTTAADDYVSTYQGVAATGNVKTNDSDPEGNAQTVTAQNTTIPGKGTLVLATDGTYTFTPVAGATGPLDFTYTTCDNASPSVCANGTLHVLINPFNPNPDFTVTNKNTPVTGGVNTNDTVPVGTTYSSPGNPASQPAGSAPTLTLTSTGSYTFTSATPGVYVYNVPVCLPGQSANCPTTPLTITVLDPAVKTNNPVANPDFASLTGAPTSPASITVNVKANDGPGNAGGTLGTPTIPSQPAHGTASIDGNGNLIYTPTAGYYGTDVVTYQICETPGTNLCASTTVTITVKAPGSPAAVSINDDYVATTAGIPATGSVLTNDQGTGLSVSNAGTITNTMGTLVLTSTGSYTFTPAANFTGPASFTYTACDNSTPSVCGSATLHILVNQGMPDLTPSQFFSSTQIPEGQTVDMLVAIRNVSASPTTGTIVFTVTNYIASSGLIITPNTDATVSIGGDVFQLNSSAFTYTVSPFAFTFTSVAGPAGVINGQDRKYIAFKITRPAGSSRGATTNTVTIQDNTGGGEAPVNNNTISNTVLKP